MTDKDKSLKDTILKIVGSTPSSMKKNYDAQYNFEKETNEIINALAEFGIALTDDSGEYRPTSDVLNDIAQKWNT